MKTVIISGASGFIGHHLCNEFIKSWHVIGIGTKKENLPKCDRFIEANLNEIKWTDLPKVDVCFHLGANNDTTELDREKMFKENLSWGANFFESLINKGCKKFIYASSCSIYGNQPTPFIEDYSELIPKTPYAESKYLFEKFAQAFATKHNVVVTGLRYSNVYGTGELHKGHRASMITQIIQKALKNETVNLFLDGKQKRDWVYIDDVITATLLCLLRKKSSIYNVGSGEQISFNDLTKIIGKALNREVSIKHGSCPPFIGYQADTLASISKSRNNLGFTPKYNVENGISEYIKKAGY